MEQQGNELGEFLRARRSAISPRQAGLPDGDLRRVAGLRREEVSALAGVSADYYTRLEQGRERHPSDQVLRAIARALQLDAHAAQHLERLTRPRQGFASSLEPHEASESAAQAVCRAINAPAMILSPALDIIAMNAPARALYSDFSRAENLAQMVFLDRAAQEFYVEWEEVARDTAGNLRSMSAAHREDPRIAEVVGGLAMKSDMFSLFWMRHDVRPRTSGSKRFRHGSIGMFCLDYVCFSVNGAPGQQLLIYSAEPDSADAHALTLLNW